MLSQPFQRFIEASPVTVMLRGVVERTLNAEWLDAWFERTAESQYTRELLFSTVFDLMLQVVCGVRRTVGSAYQAHEHTFPSRFKRSTTNSKVSSRLRPLNWSAIRPSRPRP